MISVNNKLLVFVCSLVLSSFVFLQTTLAQTELDLFRYSKVNTYGNARFNAMGGAFGALGGNFTALSTNPASIGLYSRAEINITGALTIGELESSYFGERAEDNSLAFNIPSGGFVLPVYGVKTKGKGELKRLQIAFGINRIADFNSSRYVRGFNDKGSFMDDVVAQSQGVYYERLSMPGYLAYYTGLMDPTDSINNLYSTILQGGNLQQYQILERRGNITEMAFSFGGNVLDMLYFGFTVGVPVVDFKENSLYVEENTEGINFPYNFENYNYSQTIKVNGVGVNLKMGLIYQPVHFLRIGANFHTPTYYSLNERYEASMQTHMSHPDPLVRREESASSVYSYKVFTPAKGGLSLGFILGKRGLIGLEGELIDYGGMRVDIYDDIEYQSVLNNIVDNNYGLGGNFRFGTEWRFNPISIRAGYIFEAATFKNNYADNLYEHSVTAGLGLSLSSFYIDFSYTYKFENSTDFLYSPSDLTTGASITDPVYMKGNKMYTTLTFGYRF